MPIVIIQSKNESMAKRFFELNIKGEVDFIREPQDFTKVLIRQNSLFSRNSKKVFCFINMLNKKFANELTTLEKQDSNNKLFFLQFVNGKIFMPFWVKKQAKIYDLDQLSRSFSFWQKVAIKMEVKIEYEEWQRAITILGNRYHLLFSALEQKRIVPKYKLDFFVQNWPEGNIFKLVDALDHKNASEALRILQFFWQRDEDPGLILNTIARHFIQLQQVKNGAKIAIHPYALIQLKKAIVYYKKGEIEQILTYLLKLDIKSKTGYLESSQKNRELIYFLFFSLLFLSAQSWQPAFWQPEI